MTQPEINRITYAEKQKPFKMKTYKLTFCFVKKQSATKVIHAKANSIKEIKQEYGKNGMSRPYGYILKNIEVEKVESLQTKTLENGN